jgi:hypothetical protein
MKKANRFRMPQWFSKEDAVFFRSHFTEQEFREFIKQKTGLIQESIEAGIPLEDIKHYWYKSKKYSIFAKNKELDLIKLTDELIKNIKESAPVFKPINRIEYNKPVLFCLSPADIHFGKLAIKEETGNEYDLEIASKRMLEGVIGLLEYTQNFNIEKIILVGGNDILHTDTILNTTTKGTPQDVSGKFYETYNAAFETYVKVIDILLQVADIHYVHCMSNHDYLSGFYLSKCLEAYYTNNKNISFNTSTNPRKYVHYGINLLGFSHGDTAKDSDLINLMKIEAKASWSKCKFGYWYLGHLHHQIRKNYNKTISKEFNDVTIIKDSHNIIKDSITVEYIKSLSGTDAWHNSMGYKATPAIEGFLHCPANGQIARFTKHVE